MGWEVLDSGSISWSAFFPMKSLFIFGTKEIHNNFLFWGTNVYVLCLQEGRKESRERERIRVVSNSNFLQNHKLGPVWKYERSAKWTRCLCLGNKNEVNHVEVHIHKAQLGSIWTELRQQHAHPKMLEGAGAGRQGRVISCHWPSGSLKWLPGTCWLSHSWVTSVPTWLMKRLQAVLNIMWKGTGMSGGL